MTLSTLKPRLATIDTRRGAAAATERIRGHELQRIRKRIMLRDGCACRICGWVSMDLIVDHITPLHLGGIESDWNRQLLCYDCHRAKCEQEEKGRQ